MLFIDYDKFVYEYRLRPSIQDDAWEMHWARSMNPDILLGYI